MKNSFRLHLVGFNTLIMISAHLLLAYDCTCYTNWFFFYSSLLLRTVVDKRTH